MVRFVLANDTESFEAYLNSNKCVLAKSGLRVTVTDSPGMFGSIAGFVYRGEKFWTVREALEYGK